MKDVKYYKEGAHNYMVLICSGNEEKSYQQKMLERQNLPHIFPCKIKYLNGKAFYYYDITSKVNMQNLYRAKEWNLSMIRKVLTDYEIALGELDSFLLEQDKLILEPEYIYYDYGSDKYIFLFYPDYQEEKNPYEALFDFWVEHLDNQDAAAVECIYKLYEEAENCCLGIGRIKELLEQYGEVSSGQERVSAAGSEGLPENGVGQIYRDIDVQAIGRSSYTDMTEMSYTQPQEVLYSSPGTVFYGIFLVLVVLGEAAVGAVYFLFQCSDKEKMILLAAAVVLACLLVCVGRLLLKERNVQKRKENYDRALTEFRENDYESVRQPAPEQVQMKEFLSVGKTGGYDVKSAAGDGENTYDKGVTYSGGETGGTVFFSSEAVFENRLYALDKKNKQHISLDALPVTIGKLKGAVDICINDTSVSRMHAQIETDGKAFYIKDLNSTNGTFVNGLRLNPNARMEIEPGDEIRLGKLRYVFR